MRKCCTMCYVIVLHVINNKTIKDIKDVHSNTNFADIFMSTYTYVEKSTHVLK